jgi:hypothetical protein
MSRAVALFLACLAAVLGIAAAQSYGDGVMDCSSIPGCAQCVPFAYNIREAAEKFSAEKSAKVQARQARAAAKSAKAGTAGAAAAPNTPAGRGLLTVDEAESLDAADTGVAAAADASGMAVVPSCVACEAGFALVTRSVRGRPPMGRCGELFSWFPDSSRLEKQSVDMLGSNVLLMGSCIPHCTTPSSSDKLKSTVGN